MTAAAFAKGLLQLDGEITPILTSLVRKDKEVNSLLDDTSAARDSKCSTARHGFDTLPAISQQESLN